MNETILIVEDQFVEANDIRLMLEKANYRVTGIARSVARALELIAEEKPDVVLLDIFLKGTLTGIDLAKQLRELNIAFVYLSANFNQNILSEAKTTQPDGFLVKPFREKDVLITLEIALYRHQFSHEASLRREIQLQKQLIPLFDEKNSWEEALVKAGQVLQPFIPFEYMATQSIPLAHNSLSYQDTGFLRIGFDEYQIVGVRELMIITNLKKHELDALQAKTHLEPVAHCYTEEQFTNLCEVPSIRTLIMDTFQMRSHCVLPVSLSNGDQFYFFFYSRRPDAYKAEHIVLFNCLQPLLSSVIESRLKTEIKVLPESVHTPLPEETQTDTDIFEGIVGRSHLLLKVFDHITLVAPADTSVLILGESGTGKERIADCIHTLSPRKDKPLVKVNCAALPATLIESELFGHEKGAFTGAIEKRIGKFEQASGGTIFLDEIGEMPLELQVKLLRVLQEKEIERIGGRSPIKINVRIIAATNRNLEKEVAQGRFRLDLYYRLHVFPIILPPLRERKEDIPVLTTYFIKHYNRKTGRKISGVTDKVLATLMTYHWPGNVRELEHLIERSVLLTKGPQIEEVEFHSPQQTEKALPNEELRIKTIDENERDHIITVLKKCNGRIWGSGGAAELLNIPPTTLQSKMKKLSIKKEYVDYK
ncbi:sigma 54-interacting transcriptional regulator [Cytophagaceae bacterium YF14B1]|uniref:Sigma 54-interacting transcriptional regulator n=1 Tax=Xanthocytophaga flava TaxID=3048013 RepID=A0AAE3QQM7_9BACT|nr:sigma 54-interacting transcriptional regulator [Xanthocytophaga flavus]MDJ1480953.1 sigma 54-interacting transcriptional regulator [Xanthocytophaga flavus]